ncbi:MAG: TIGR00730 family Rossman fold protein [Sulfuriferula sp.]|nr:TIGR00730 family Rossman fold protein [Sulfuriferula sp.]
MGRPMHKIRKICVYCGSSMGVDPAFVEAARAFGRILADNDIGLVYGGGDLGLMGAVAHSVLSAGGHVTGIIPHFLQKRENMLESVQELVVVEDMHERKRLMFEKADGFVALPGGIGTLEELVEQLTWVQLERHDKPVLIADIGGFWGPLLALLDHMRDQGFIRANLEARYLIRDRVEDILPALQEAVARKRAPHLALRPEF